VPLIIAAPQQKNRGQACYRTVELLDIYPTLADLCGLKPAQPLAGRSLRSLLDNPQAPWDKPAFSQVWRNGFPGHSVRTERYRYTEWDGGLRGVELYDYEKDPGETRNLAKDPAYAEVAAQLRQYVRQNWREPYRPAPATGGKAANPGKARNVTP
jgi:uncharacterized sulfatase